MFLHSAPFSASSVYLQDGPVIVRGVNVQPILCVVPESKFGLTRAITAVFQVLTECAWAQSIRQRLASRQVVTVSFSTFFVINSVY